MCLTTAFDINFTCHLQGECVEGLESLVVGGKRVVRDQIRGATEWIVANENLHIPHVTYCSIHGFLKPQIHSSVYGNCNVCLNVKKSAIFVVVYLRKPTSRIELRLDNQRTRIKNYWILRMSDHCMLLNLDEIASVIRELLLGAYGRTWNWRALLFFPKHYYKWVLIITPMLIFDFSIWLQAQRAHTDSQISPVHYTSV